MTSVLNGASYQAQLCPGVLAVVYGSNFGTSAANVSVAVGGKPGYVLPPVLATQITVEIPFEVSPGAATLTVTVSGAQSAPFNITLATYAPGISTQNSTGTGLASVLNSNNKVVSLAAPAHPGDQLIVYAVGLGPTSPPTATGPTTASNQTAGKVTVTVGGVPATIFYAGLATAPLYQINFLVPAGVQGTVPLVVGIGGVSSSTAVTVALAGLSSVVNNASFANPGTASPGGIVTAFANGLGTTTDQLSGIFPSNKAQGVQLTFNGAAAPLFHLVASVAQQQVDLLVPTELPSSGTVNVQLATSTIVYPNYTLNMVPATPGFYRIQDPKVASRSNAIAQFANTAWLALPVSTTAALGLPACNSSTSTLTVCGQPATAGDYLVLYATGLGLATPGGDPNGKPLPTGSIPPANGSILYQTPTTPVVTVGGIPAKVLFSGIAPGFPGEYQIDIQIPAGVTASDDTAVQVTILGASDKATIAIQPRAN